MNARQSILVAAGLIVGTLILTVSLSRPMDGQAAAPAPAAHYQMRVMPDSNTVVVTDTVSGRTWIHGADTSGGWRDLGPLNEPQR